MNPRKLKAAIRHLRQAAELLAECDYTLGNGAEADSLVGGIADEIEALVKLNAQARIK